MAYGRLGRITACVALYELCAIRQHTGDGIAVAGSLVKHAGQEGGQLVHTGRLQAHGGVFAKLRIRSFADGSVMLDCC